MLPVADVEGQDEGIGSQSGQLGLQGLPLLGLAAVDDDVIAACCELSRAGLADTACGTGDKCRSRSGRRGWRISWCGSLPTAERRRSNVLR